MDCKEREISILKSYTNMMKNTQIVPCENDLHEKFSKQSRLDFAEANKENKNITFLTVGLTNETQKGASIYLYTDGFSVNENFEPPSKPATVTGSDINHSSVTLNFLHPDLELRTSPPTLLSTVSVERTAGNKRQHPKLKKSQ
ncbi:hypothetical protein F7725_010959 [Dissostichus mawsoni]|uniref:SNTX thioredoxin-like domain-containing protein n=1 Tax=Dissostichus mawsoni TaxID=36200 RepID=A0A7J5ZBQ2_DISMA|nr:hypothetical protein F7725_010959 [Dissostichus mawsoni]